MDLLRIRGTRPLQGAVKVEGAKNAALPCMAAALLTPDAVTLTNVPRVQDIRTLAQLLTHFGAEGSFDEEAGVMRLSAAELRVSEAPYDLVRKMRASVLTLGPMLARLGHAEISLPGGCAIGTRPIDMHLEGLRRLGAKVSVEHGYVRVRTEGGGRLRGGEFSFDLKSVTGTENLMMAAVLAEGTTILRNCACEPEVSDLAALLNAMGAKISGAGTDTVTIEGVASLHAARHAVIPDRIVAGTYIIAACMAGGDVTVRGAVAEHLQALLDKLRGAGVAMDVQEKDIRVRREGELKAQDIVTLPFPGFPTDLQAQFMALMTQARGISVMEETIFENRFMHAAELQRMGADIRSDGGRAVVFGPTPLSGAHVMATDLRASASLVLAGLAAEGETVVHRVYHLDRGYPRLDETLRSLGADIERGRE